MNLGSYASAILKNEQNDFSRNWYFKKYFLIEYSVAKFKIQKPSLKGVLKILLS